MADSKQFDDELREFDASGIVNIQKLGSKLLKAAGTNSTHTLNDSPTKSFLDKLTLHEVAYADTYELSTAQKKEFLKEIEARTLAGVFNPKKGASKNPDDQ